MPGACQQQISVESIDMEDVDQELRPILSEPAIITQDFVWLIFPHREGVAQIIDGQHRMSGFEFASQDLKFDLPVTFFLDQDLSAQAETFAVINGKQTRVTPSLVFDLFGTSPQRNPYTVAGKIVRSLNEDEQSPLKETIKILGRSNSIYTGSFTQSTVAKAIIELICGDVKQAEEDKRRIRKKEELSEFPTATKKKAVLRKYFVNEKDEIIYKVLLNFFRAVSIVLSDEWNKPGSVLRKTIGFSALMKVMSQFIEDGTLRGTLSERYFSERLLPFASINFDDVQLSSKGIRQLLEKFQ